jgi:hypothetical protein
MFLQLLILLTGKHFWNCLQPLYSSFPHLYRAYGCQIIYRSFMQVMKLTLLLELLTQIELQGGSIPLCDTECN